MCTFFSQFKTLVFVLLFCRDLLTGGECSADAATGLPDANCIFYPDGDNSLIRTSMMAAPFLESVGGKKYIRKIPEFKRNCMLFFTRPPCSARTTPRSTPTAPTCRRCRTTSASSSPPGKSSPEARTLPAPPRWSSPPPPTLRSSARRRATSSWCSTPPAAWRRAPTGSSGSSRRPSGGYS